MQRLKGFSGGWAKKRGPHHVGALVAYAGIFLALMLPKLLPARPGRILASSPADGAIFLWSLGWWPHALAHGTFLPYTHAVFAPSGTNLAWTTSIPLPSLLASPVTKGGGIFAAFNVLAVAAPITAAWTTYLLVSRVTRRWWPSLLAGLLFALSPLETTEVAIGHLNLSLVALVPLAVYLVVRRLEGSIGPVPFVLLLGIVLAAELGVSTEIFATTTLFGGISLLLVHAWDRDRRQALRSCAVLVGMSYVVAGLLAAPLVYGILVMPHPRGLVSIASPPARSSGIGHAPSGVASAGGAGDPHTSGADSSVAIPLLQLPLIVVLLTLAWVRRREPVLRSLAVTALLALVCSAGIVVVGSRTLPTPWALATHLPLLRLVQPQRLTMFAWLIAAVGVGVWLVDQPRTWLRRAAAATLVVAGLPAIWSGQWTSTIRTPSFVTAEPPALAAGANVLIVAGPGPGSRQLVDLATPTVWQAESGFAFRLADAYVGSLHPSLPPAVHRLVLSEPVPQAQSASLLQWLSRAGVRVVVLMRPTPAVVHALQVLLRTEPRRLDGVIEFRVRPSG